MAVLSTGSGKKLRTALKRTMIGANVAVPQHPMSPVAQQASRSVFAHNRVVGYHGPWHPVAARQRWFSSLVPEHGVRSTHTVPHAAEPSMVPNPRSQAACDAGVASWVCDPGNLLSSSTREELEHIMERINTQTGVECALVTLVDLRGGGSDPARFREFGIKLFNHWGVGSAAHNNGLLVLLFMEARRLEIVSGAGISKVLPDAWLGDMQHRAMLPHFIAGSYSTGLKAGLQQIEQQLSGAAHGNWINTHGSLLPRNESFGGGGAALSPEQGPNSQQQDLGDKHGLRLLTKFGAFVAAAWFFGDSETNDPVLVDLKRQLAALDHPSVFRDSKGAAHPWPYRVKPDSMDLLDVSSESHSQQQQEQLPHVQNLYMLACNGQLSFSARARGFGQQALEIHIRNNSSDAVVVELPAGSMFVANAAERTQPLIAKESSSEWLGSDEERTLQIDVYCGDSGGTVPRCNMVLSPYILPQEYLDSQRSVWSWSAPYQPCGTAWRPAVEDYSTLEKCFGMSRPDVEALARDCLARAGDSARARDEQRESLHRRIAAESARIQREREQRSRDQIARSGTSGSRGFSGGCSAGGGAGSSW